MPALPPEVWGLVFTHLRHVDLIEHIRFVSRDFAALALHTQALRPALWAQRAAKSCDKTRLDAQSVRAQVRREYGLVRAITARPPVFDVDRGPLRAAAFSPKSDAVVIVSHQGYTAERSLMRHTHAGAAGHGWRGRLLLLSRVHNAHIAADTKLIVMASDTTVALLGRDDGSPKLRYVDHKDVPALFCASLSPSSTEVAAATDEASLAIWPCAKPDVPSFVLALAETPSKTYLSRCHWSPRGERLAGVTGHGQAFVWDLRCPHDAPKRVGTQNVTALVFAQDGRHLVTGQAHGRLHVFDVTRLKDPVAQLHAHQGASEALSFSFDNNTIVSGSSFGDVVLWRWQRAAPKACFARLLGHSRRVTAAAFNVDDSLVLTADDDGRVRLWPVPTDAACGLRHVIDARPNRPKQTASL